MDFPTSYAAGISLLVLLVAFLLHSRGFVRWLQKKNYQYEVTFALYMLTPTEKFIFNSVLFLTMSMVIIASVVYLPDHIMTISRRAYYYCAGNDAQLMSSSRHAAETLYGSATRAGDAVLDAAMTAYQAATNKSAANVAQGVAELAGEKMGEA